MTFEELKEKYPIGTKLGERILDTTFEAYYYNDNDLKFYSNQPNVVSVICTSTPNICSIRKCQTTYTHQVDGYLYDGEWHLVQNTWDGYVPIEIKK